MIINRTPEQQKKLDDLLARIRNDYISKLDAQDTAEARSALMMEIQDAIDTFKREEEEEAFKALHGDHKAILNNAKAQVSLITEQVKDELLTIGTDEYRKDLEKMEILRKKGGTYYISSLYMFSVLRDELRLHRESLQENKKESDALNKIIMDAVLNCPYVDEEDLSFNGDIEPPALPSNYFTPWTHHIKTIGLMKDRINTFLVSNHDFLPDIKPDGQMTWHFEIDQNAGNKRKIAIMAEMTYEGNNPALRKRFTAYDNNVYGAVANIYYQWSLNPGTDPLVVTPLQIFRLMNGKEINDASVKPSKAQLQKVTNSLDKMRFTHLYLDISNEVAANKKVKEIAEKDTSITRGIFDGYLLPMEYKEVRFKNGEVAGGYEPLRMPFFYAYNEAKGNILFVDRELLDTSQETSNSEYVIEIRTYLLIQIKKMQTKQRDSNRIKIATIYRDLNIPTPEDRLDNAQSGTKDKKPKQYADPQREIRKIRARDREKIEGIFNAWIKKKFIKGFTPVKDGREIVAYDIDFNGEKTGR